jgi:hypothetical protein
MGLHVNLWFQANSTHISQQFRVWAVERKSSKICPLASTANLTFEYQADWLVREKADLIVIRKGDDGATDPKDHGGMDFTMCVRDRK